MPYASLADLIAAAGEDEILQVADRDNDGVPDAVVIAEALERADSTINASIAVAYTLPIVPAPAILGTWAVSLARYFLHRDGPPEHVVRDHKYTLQALKEAAEGKLKLTADNGEKPEASNSSEIRVVGPEPVFSADKLEGWL